MTKETLVSSGAQPEETTADRLRTLIGERSVRAAAKVWGLPYSTVSNYLTRNIEPSLDAAIRIAQAEGVDVIWLAKGIGEATAKPITCEPVSSTEQAWNLIYQSIGPDVISDFIKLVHRKGIEGIMALEREPVAKDKVSQEMSPQMRQLVELVTSCSDAEVREILQRATHIKSTATPDSEDVSQVTKKVS